jgi:hypothetical protein
MEPPEPPLVAAPPALEPPAFDVPAVFDEPAVPAVFDEPAAFAPPLPFAAPPAVEPLAPAAAGLPLLELHAPSASERIGKRALKRASLGIP